MPIHQSAYMSPNVTRRKECTCYLSIDDETSSEHSCGCAVSKADFVDLREQMSWGSSLQAFAHEWDAVVAIEASAVQRDASLEVTDYPEFTGHLVAALLEEQRTANLIAIASSDTFCEGLRYLAREAVMDRLDLDRELLDQVEKES